MESLVLSPLSPNPPQTFTSLPEKEKHAGSRLRHLPEPGTPADPAFPTSGASRLEPTDDDETPAETEHGWRWLHERLCGAH